MRPCLLKSWFVRHESADYPGPRDSPRVSSLEQTTAGRNNTTELSIHTRQFEMCLQFSFFSSSSAFRSPPDQRLVRQLDFECDSVLHRTNPRRRPRRPLCLFPLRPCPDTSFQDGLAPCASTVILPASIVALRTNAPWIFFFPSEGVTCGLTMISLMTPLTPKRRRSPS